MKDFTKIRRLTQLAAELRTLKQVKFAEVDNEVLTFRFDRGSNIRAKILDNTVRLSQNGDVSEIPLDEFEDCVFTMAFNRRQQPQSV